MSKKKQKKVKLSNRSIISHKVRNASIISMRFKVWCLIVSGLVAYGGNLYVDGYEAALNEHRQQALSAPVNSMLVSMIKTESNFNPNAISPKGARGITQVMPDTAKQPGFGVEPMRNNSVREQIRFGNDYLNAMEKKYKSKVLAAAAYNAGPKAVDDALHRAKGNTHKAIKHLPAETQSYVVKVASYHPPKQHNIFSPVDKD